MVFYLLIEIAFVIQVAAIFLLFQPKYFLVVLLCHFMASLCVGIAVYIRRHYFDRFNFSIVILFFLFAFIVPVFGIIGVIVLMRWLKKSQKIYAQPKIYSVFLNKDLDLNQTQYGMGGLRIRLQSLHFSTEERVRALSRVSTLQPAAVNQLVRDLLPDSHEEIRIFAFRLLEKQERKLTQGIQDALGKLKDIEDVNVKADIHKWLALQYWEFIYTKLIDPGLEKKFIQKVLFHAEEARKILIEDAPLTFFSGRVYLWSGDMDAAQTLFEKCLQLGTSPDRVAPYLAENYFYCKQYEKIKFLFSKLSALKYIPISRDLFNFWIKSNE